MKTTEMKAIMELMASNGISSLTYQNQDENLSLTREVTTTANGKLDQEATETETTSRTGKVTIKAPFVGIFYTASSPDEAPFVQVGDTVEKGQTVAIIESMKMMNNVVADQPGRITKVLVANEEQVEFDQPLFEIESL